MRKIITTAICALSLLGGAAIAQAAPQSFFDSSNTSSIVLKGSPVPYSSLKDMGSGNNLLVEGFISKAATPGTGNYVLRDSAGGIIPVQVDNHVLQNNSLNNQFVRVRGNVAIVQAGTRMVNASHVEIVN